MLFRLNRAMNEAANDGDKFPIKVKRECADAFLGAGLGNGSNLLLEERFTNNPKRTD